MHTDKFIVGQSMYAYSVCLGNFHALPSKNFFYQIENPIFPGYASKRLHGLNTEKSPNGDTQYYKWNTV